MITIFKNLLLMVGALVLLAVLFITLIIIMWVVSAIVVAFIDYINEKGE